MIVMKPILILQHAKYDWPGYLLDYFIEFKIPYVVIDIDQGDQLPNDLLDFSGFAIMGGAMSANDEKQLPYMAKAYDLLALALQQRVPVIGHCLGGQMLARAIGGKVVKAKNSEIGWLKIQPELNSVSLDWWGDAEPSFLFEWHNETFELPSSVQLIATSAYCKNQAFVYDEIHLGMQFHVEALSDKINYWISTARSDLEIANNKNIQSESTIKQLNSKMETLSMSKARQLYSRWLRSIVIN